LTRIADSISLREALRVIVVVEAGLAAPRSVVEIVQAALAGGARAIQLRNKGDSARELMAAGERLAPLLRQAGTLFFINDRLDVALALDADGVHLGPDDLPVAAVRAAAPTGFLIGRSADEARVALGSVADGADYIGCGTVFATSTKPDAGQVIGVEGLRRVVEAVPVPVVGIGGVTVERVREVTETGAAGVAVVNAVMSASDPASVVRRMLQSFANASPAASPPG
jgi:thiamine-phosphate diphosphorylase